MERDSVANSLFSSLFDKLDPVQYVNEQFLKSQRKKLFDYQEQIVRAIADTSVRKMAILCSRQAGKTESVAAGTLFIADNFPGTKIGFFAPARTQAGLGVDRIKGFIDSNTETRGVKTVKDNQSVIKLSNRSEIHIISASDQANIEGFTFNVIVLDESQKISDYTVSERILPMGGATGAKIIQIGTPKYKNHFWKAFQDPSYKCFRFDWLDCHNLHKPENGVVNIGGRNYGLFVLDRMPRILKHEFFAVEYQTALETDDYELIKILDSDGDMDPIDFRTQYMLDWITDADGFLGIAEIDILKSGTHDFLDEGIRGEEYYAGIDFAGSESYGSDYTAISVWRKTITGHKEKVFFFEMFGTPYPTQMEIISDLFAGDNPVFAVRRVYADYTGVGKPVVQMLEHCGVPITGIIFNASDTILNSGANFKTSMFNTFKMELINGRLRYCAKPKNNAKAAIIWNKALDEWSGLECKESQGINKKIKAPDGGHDDHPCADVLAVFAACAEGIRSFRPRGVLANFRRR